MRILFITATRIGDAVLSTGLLRHLLRLHPAAAVTVACGPAAAGVFARMPNRAATIVLRKRRGGRHWLDLWRATVATRWDLVVDLRASAFAWTVRAGRRVTAPGGRRPGHRIGHLGALLGLDPPPLPVAWWNAADAARVAALLPAGPFVALGPTANWAPKVWSTERFAAVFAAVAPPGARAVVLGGEGPTEAAMAAPLLAALGDRAIDLTGRLTLPEAAAVLSRAALYVGNDSGLMHLAAAAGAPTVGLFGPTPADEYAPVGPRAVAVSAPGGAAMAGLAVAPVVDAARRLLAVREPA